MPFLFLLALLPPVYAQAPAPAPVRAAFLPAGDVFAPLAADPREAQVHLSAVAARGAFDTTLWLADHGESVGLVRWTGPRRAVQVGLALAKLAQLDLGAPSNDLINADYLIGLPLSVRQNAFSARLHVYHVSAHLGDEYLVRTGTSPQNVSYETADLVASGERSGWRVYGGVSYAFRRSSSSPRPGAVQLGAEWQSPPVFRGPAGAIGRLVAAADGRFTRERGWQPGLSLRAGLELGSAGHHGLSKRRLSLLGELYTGPVPYGQFFREDFSYAGGALRVNL